MLREIQREVPEHLKGLVNTCTDKNLVVLGDKVYEMAPMCYADFKDAETILKAVMDSIVKDGSINIDTVVKAIFMSGLMDKILGSQFGFSKEEISRFTVPQIVYAAEVWISVNFLSLPKESLRRWSEIIVSLITTIVYPALGIPQEMTEETMETEKTEKKSSDS